MFILDIIMGIIFIWENFSEDVSSSTIMELERRQEKEMMEYELTEYKYNKMLEWELERIDHSYI